MALKLKVLFFDDDKSVLSAFRRFFRTSGIADSYFSKEDDLIGAARRGHADLLVSDVRVPGVNILDLLTEFKKKYPECDIVLLSGDPHSDRVRTLCGYLDIRRVIRKDSESAGKLLEEIKVIFTERDEGRDTALVLDNDIEDLIPAFIEARIDDCRKGVKEISQGNLTEASGIAHRLKGVGTMYGFDYISRIGEEIESTVKSVDKESSKGKFLDLIEYLEKIEYRFN